MRCRDQRVGGTISTHVHWHSPHPYRSSRPNARARPDERRFPSYVNLQIAREGPDLLEPGNQIADSHPVREDGDNMIPHLLPRVPQWPGNRSHKPPHQCGGEDRGRFREPVPGSPPSDLDSAFRSGRGHFRATPRIGTAHEEADL